MRAVELQADATLSAEHVEVRTLQASSGGARAWLTGRADRRDAASPWTVAARLGLARFDPTPWWAGPAGSPWRQGPHQLNAEARANLTVALPANAAASAASEPVRGSSTRRGKRPAPSSTLLSTLAALHGQLEATIAPSVLAGVPLSGSFKAERAQGGSSWQAKGQAEAAGNTASFEGRMALAGTGANDHWHAEVKAPSLEPLRPLMALTSTNPAPLLGGSLNATADMQGRWPALSTNGKLEANNLRVGTASMNGAQARWQLGTAPDAPLDLRLAVAQAALDKQRADSISIQLQGTAKAHRLDARARLQALPPQWADTLNMSSRPGGASRSSRAASAAVGAGTRADAARAGASAVAAAASSNLASSTARPGGAASAALPPAGSPTATAPAARATQFIVQAQGGAIAQAGRINAVSGWKGTLERIDVADSTGSRAPWLHVEPAAIEANFSDAASYVALSPSRAEVLGAGLRWTRFYWQGGDSPRMDGTAELDPLPVAPLLAKLQPEFGWSGDLTLAAKLQASSNPQVKLNAELYRVRGDLRLNPDPQAADASAASMSTIALGLRELRVAATAQNGLWRFTQAMSSASLGTLSGSQTAHASPGDFWPAADAPLEGSLTARLEDLAGLSPWVPAGWRIAGKLDADARVGGRMGAPEYSGTIAGQGLAARNLLQGVNLTDGELRVALQGTSARIERFTAKAGKGDARVTGGATFGAEPTAELQLIADHFEVFGRVDRRIVLSGEARMRMDARTLGVEGRFKLDEGLVDFTRSDAPSLDDDVHVIRVRQTSAGPGPAEPSQPAISRNVSIDVDIDLGDKLRIRGRGIDTGLGGRLRIVSADDRLSARGTLGTIGGTYKAYGQNLSIDRGVLIFNGPIDNPRLDIEATRSDIDTRVGVQVSGSALTPRVRLFSDDAMTDIDRLSWLVLGRAPDTVGGSDAALLQHAALGLLSGDKGDSSNSIVKSLGLDDLSLGQTGDGDARQTVVSLGKQISKRVYVGFERSLNGTAGGWQLIYRIAQRFTLRAQTGADSSVDLIWVWRWN